MEIEKYKKATEVQSSINICKIGIEELEVAIRRTKAHINKDTPILVAVNLIHKDKVLSFYQSEIERLNDKIKELTKQFEEI